MLIQRTGADDDDEVYDYAADGTRLRKTLHRVLRRHRDPSPDDGDLLPRRLRVPATTRTPASSSSAVVEQRGRRRPRDAAATGDSGHPGARDRRHHRGPQRTTTSARILWQRRASSPAGPRGFSDDEEYFPYGRTAFLAGDSLREIQYRTLRYVGNNIRDDATGFYAFSTDVRAVPGQLGQFPTRRGRSMGRTGIGTRGTTEAPASPIRSGWVDAGDWLVDLSNEAQALRYYNMQWARFHMLRITDLTPDMGAPGQRQHRPGGIRPADEEEWQASLQEERALADRLIPGEAGASSCSPRPQWTSGFTSWGRGR